MFSDSKVQRFSQLLERLELTEAAAQIDVALTDYRAHAATTSDAGSRLKVIDSLKTELRDRAKPVGERIHFVVRQVQRMRTAHRGVLPPVLNELCTAVARAVRRIAYLIVGGRCPTQASAGAGFFGTHSAAMQRSVLRAGKAPADRFLDYAYRLAGMNPK